MYMLKAIAAFIMLIVNALVAAPDIIPVKGTVHLIIAIIAIVAGAVIVYAVPNRPSVVQRIAP